MELIKIRFDSVIGKKTIKVHPQKIIATEICEVGYYPDDTPYNLLIRIEGGHTISMDLPSAQNCLDIEQAIWAKVESVVNSGEPLECKVHQEA